MRFSRSTHLLFFFLRNFNVHHKDWPTYYGGSDWPGELRWSQMALLRWLTFLLGSQTVILIVLLFWICVFFLTLVFVLQWLYLHWEILIMLLPCFHWLPIKFTTVCLVWLHFLWLFSFWLGWSSWSCDRCSMGGYL